MNETKKKFSTTNKNSENTRTIKMVKMFFEDFCNSDKNYKILPEVFKIENVINSVVTFIVPSRFTLFPVLLKRFETDFAFYSGLEVKIKFDYSDEDYVNSILNEL